MIQQLYAWTETDGRGRCCTNAGFMLPNHAVRSPSKAWISSARTESVAENELEKFPHLCPEFVIELLSPSDSLPALKRKMQEWIDSGAELGWLIDPFERVLYEYTRNGMRKIDAPAEMIGTGPVEGFRLKLESIWERR